MAHTHSGFYVFVTIRKAKHRQAQFCSAEHLASRTGPGFMSSKRLKSDRSVFILFLLVSLLLLYLPYPRR